LGDSLLLAGFLANHKSSAHFGATFFLGQSYAFILTKMVWLHFGRFFEKTHLVTLTVAAKMTSKISNKKLTLSPASSQR
jgi:hypothetical protein